MVRMAVITKSFAPDFDLCAALNRSVLDTSPGTVEHRILVPQSDLELFGRLEGQRTHICCEAVLLPRMFVRLPFVTITINLQRPLPPVRGWIQQQVVKLAAIGASQDDVVPIVDSDAEFVQPFSAETFVRNGIVRFFRKSRSHRQAPAAPHDLAPGSPRTSGIASIGADLPGLHLVAPCLGPRYRQTDVGAGCGHDEAAVAHRDCRATRLLRVRTLWRVRRRRRRCAGQLVYFQ